MFNCFFLSLHVRVWIVVFGWFVIIVISSVWRQCVIVSGVLLTSKYACFKISPETSRDSNESLYRCWEALPNCWTRTAESTSSIGGPFDWGHNKLITKSRMYGEAYLREKCGVCLQDIYRRTCAVCFDTNQSSRISGRLNLTQRTWCRWRPAFPPSRSPSSKWSRYRPLPPCSQVSLQQYNVTGRVTMTTENSLNTWIHVHN